MTKMIELNGVCGNKIAIAPDSIEYLQECLFCGVKCTLICFRSGKKMYIDAEYRYLKEMLGF